MSTWFTAEDGEPLERLLVEWPDAPEERPETLSMLLDTAMCQVIAYAQGLPDDAILDDYVLLDAEGEEITEIPPRLVYAQLCHSQDLWKAGQVTSDDGSFSGVDAGFTFTPKTISATIKRMIRPKGGVPSVA